MNEGLWISEAEVIRLMALPEAIDALKLGLREEAAGRATNMVKTHAIWGEGSTLHAIGAVFDGWGIAGTKTWSHTAKGAMPLLVLFDAQNGSILAVIEAFALGQMRTGGISGVATDLLAAPGANRMAMIGTGKQSITQVAAVAAVRRLEHVSVWSPTPAHRELLATKIKEQLNVDASAANSLKEAIEGATIVTLATRARSPFFEAAMLAPGVHLNAVGAITPERSEFEPELLERVTIAVADSVPQVRKFSREFMDAFGDDEEQWNRLRPLSELAVREPQGSPPSGNTLFKAMGMGISDLSLGSAILRRARAEGVGKPLPVMTRQPVRLTL